MAFGGLFVTPCISYPARALGALCVFLAGLMLVGSSLATAQTTGTTKITGTVLDAQRRPVNDAQVRLSGAASASTSTAADGSFTFQNLPAGLFRLDITKAGFNGATQ